MLVLGSVVEMVIVWEKVRVCVRGFDHDRGLVGPGCPSDPDPGYPFACSFCLSTETFCDNPSSPSVCLWNENGFFVDSIPRARPGARAGR